MSKRPRPNRKTEIGVQRAIARADAILPGRPAPEGKRDPRWQAIIRVGEFMESEPQAVLQFILKWGQHAQWDLRAAIGTCLLEHLLDDQFDELFPPIRQAALKSKQFARTFEMCWWNGEAKLPKNAARIERLKKELRRVHSPKRARRPKTT